MTRQTMITNDISRIITDTLKRLGVKRPVVSLEHPTEISHGDYSTNVALVYAKKLNVSPLEVAREIVASFNEESLVGISKVEIAGFGFINFYLAPSFFSSQLENIISEGVNYGSNSRLKNKKIIIEHTDPNPFKEFHIGHLMPNIIGGSIARLIKFQGAHIKEVCYQGDVGMHIAKAIYGIKNRQFDFWKVKLFGNLFAKVKFIGQAYAFGARAFEEDEVAKKEITSLNQEIYSRTNNNTNYFYDVGKSWSLDYFNYIYKILGTNFDQFFFESEVAPIGEKIVKRYLQEGLFVESDGAVVFPGEQYGLHTRVFINSKGLPTYEAKELALATVKHDEFNYDQSLVVSANEISEYFKVILKAMSFTSPELAEKTIHIPHGFLKLPSGKMSSRTGDVISALSIIEDVKNIVLTKIKNRDLSKSEVNSIATMVSVGAIKFSILRQSIGKDIIFDFDKSISFDGDSGPYLQYSYTRAKSILDKAEDLGLFPDFTKQTEEVVVLEKILYRFPEVVERSAEEYAPHYLVTYLLELASSFNSFYGQNKIIDETDPESSYRLALTKGFMIVMKNGLYLLGIEAPEKM